ncbi:MAG: L,D-transpeptidase family protein [Candidatus Omnitrophica bacterium]|nr:L,D-transpeptidase family protein [Candidatus Omnitrophota bacterium]
MKNNLLRAAAFIVVILAALLVFYFYTHKNTSSSSVDFKSPEADAAQAQGDLLKARSIYEKALTDSKNDNSLQQIYDKIYDLNIKILFSSVLTADSQLYEITPGDSLEKIAKKFNTTTELIKKANSLTRDVIVPGRKLKVQKSTFSIVVDKSQNILTLLSDGTVFKVYNVSTGKGNCTPVGTFKIVNKLIDPPWYSAKGVIPPDSPENVLGTRWMGIDNPGYGIHGTIDPASIGFQCTEGCVRMRNAEVEELYAIVPAGTEVTITD